MKDSLWARNDVLDGLFCVIFGLVVNRLHERQSSPALYGLLNKKFIARSRLSMTCTEDGCLPCLFVVLSRPLFTTLSVLSSACFGAPVVTLEEGGCCAMEVQCTLLLSELHACLFYFVTLESAANAPRRISLKRRTLCLAEERAAKCRRVVSPRSSVKVKKVVIAASAKATASNTEQEPAIDDMDKCSWR